MNTELLAALPGLTLSVRPDPAVEPAHQVIVLAGEQAEALAALLGSADTCDWIDGAAHIPHTVLVDRRLKHFIDALVNIRMVAPGLVQLELAGFSLEQPRGALRR